MIRIVSFVTCLEGDELVALSEVAVEPDHETVGVLISGDFEVEAAGEVEILDFDGQEVEVGDKLRGGVDDLLAHLVDEPLPHDLLLHVGHLDSIDVIPELRLLEVEVTVVNRG